ncbi:hypothetical protein HDU96_003207 [Phlyctochytrium bullatum]|nr:hypothetical protein HDU96_003207 [Phlyctochytrium bullatum]
MTSLTGATVATASPSPSPSPMKHAAHTTMMAPAPSSMPLVRKLGKKKTPAGIISFDPDRPGVFVPPSAPTADGPAPVALQPHPLPQLNPFDPTPDPNMLYGAPMQRSVSSLAVMQGVSEQEIRDYEAAYAMLHQQVHGWPGSPHLGAWDWSYGWGMPLPVPPQEEPPTTMFYGEYNGIRFPGYYDENGTYRYFRSEAEAEDATTKAKLHTEATATFTTPSPSITPQPNEGALLRNGTPSAESTADSPSLTQGTVLTTPSPSPDPSECATPRQPSPVSAKATTTIINTPSPVSSTNASFLQPTPPPRTKVPPPVKASSPPPTTVPVQHPAKPITPPPTPTAASAASSLKALLSQAIPPNRADATRTTATAPATTSKRASTASLTPTPPPSTGAFNRRSLFFGDTTAAEKTARRRSTASTKSANTTNPIGAFGLTSRSLSVEAKPESTTLGRRAGRPFSAAFQLNPGRTSTAGATPIASPPALASDAGRGSSGPLLHLGWKRNGGSDRSPILETKTPIMTSPSATSFVLGPLPFEKQPSLEGYSPTSSSGSTLLSPDEADASPVLHPVSPAMQDVTSPKLVVPDLFDFGSLEEELMMEAEKRGLF